MRGIPPSGTPEVMLIHPDFPLHEFLKSRGQGWYAEFLLKIILQFLLEKTSARVNLKIRLNSLHIGPGVSGSNNFISGL